MSACLRMNSSMSIWCLNGLERIGHEIDMMLISCCFKCGEFQPQIHIVSIWGQCNSLSLPLPPEVRDGAVDGIERGVQIFPKVLGEEAEDMAAALLKQRVLAPVATIGRRIG